MTTLPEELIQNIVRTALAEDVGAGDITTEVSVPADLPGTATIIAKEPCVVAGLALVEAVFRELAGNLQLLVRDGEVVEDGQRVCEITGPARAILTGERTALNFLQQLSGIATLTRQFVEAVAGTSAQILDTRKTTPLWRELEKVAVQVGGGYNHRQGLDEFIFIKENHRVHGELSKLKRHPGQFEIEVRSLGELWEAIQLKAKVILLDNFTPKEAQRAVAIVRKEAPGIILEASGGITLENVRKFAAAGVDTISVGSLTHSVKAVDFSLLID